MRKRKRLFLEIYGADGALKARILPCEFTLPEAVVIELSERYFGDPEPCHIHRSAVLSRAMAELSEACAPGARVCVRALPEGQRAYFGQYAAEAFAFVNEEGY